MRAACGVAVACGILAGADAAAQSGGRLDDAPSEAGAQLLSIVGLAATPDITGSRLEPDDDDDDDLAGERIDVIRLGNEVSLPFEDGTLYLEGNVGFARAQVDLRLGDDVVEAVNFDAVGGFASIGPDFPVGRFTRVRPLLIFGMGYVNDDFGLPEPVAGEENAGVDLRQWSIAYGFGLSLDHERPIGADVLDLRLKFSQIYFSTLWAGDSRFSTDTSNRTVNVSAAYKRDTGLRVGTFPLLVTGLLGANAFLGDQREALGFSWFAEYGAGLELDFSEGDSAVQRARIRVTGIRGADVTGISIGLGIGF